ncbi:MAG: lycopene cyclase domain-containing protein [Candidatus Omnitrophica bacterium]|nr:lycopene cyclase domain-containing protein [Candidatus Omnitrophota bacterium]
MKEYTFIAAASVFIAVFLDARLKTSLFRKPLFYLFLFVIFLFKLLVNGYLTGNDIVMYNPYMILNFRVGSIPIEDFLFGFSMVSMSIIFWEYFIHKNKHA